MHFTFRAKLLLAMMAVVLGVTVATLFVTQSRVETTYNQLFEEQFREQIGHFTEIQETRLAAITSRCLSFARSVRFRGLMRRFMADLEAKAPDLEETINKLYLTTEDELRDLQSTAFGRTNRVFQRAALIRLLNARGELIPPPKGVDVGASAGAASARLRKQFQELAKVLQSETEQQTGYLAQTLPDGREYLLEVVLTKIFEREDDQIGELLGALVIGFAVPEFIPPGDTPPRSAMDASAMKSGVWLDEQFYSKSLSEENRQLVASAVGARIQQAQMGDFRLTIHGAPHRVFLHLLNPQSHFPKAYQVGLYSLAPSLAAQKDLRAKIAAFGALSLAVALLLSLLLAHGLSVPIRELVRATTEVKQGNLSVTVPVRSRDELGHLADSFNEMTAGLALKEKYRSVLNMVADKAIAEKLMAGGKVELGGENREVSVLFCDIRGFTALTQHMAPDEVVRMLNDHFTPLTRVVYEHQGVVDKFVGDMIMALFGAPAGSVKDCYNAVSCALSMIHERQSLNQTSKHKIQIGIGAATGEALAGCMGSSDRLSYTVLGPRVNLASRLCSQAGRMELVIDQTTREKLGDLLDAQPLPEMKLKGFTEPVQAFKVLKILPLPPSGVPVVKQT
ncbi:MAG: adenylate/guanylate cyclase domain-containing protein [Verrucomicrobiota bacterium]